MADPRLETDHPHRLITLIFLITSTLLLTTLTIAGDPSPRRPGLKLGECCGPLTYLPMACGLESGHSQPLSSLQIWEGRSLCWEQVGPGFLEWSRP